MLIHPEHLASMDLDDKLTHYLIGGVALILGSTLKAGVEWIGTKIWSRGVKKVKLSLDEHKEFEAWKATRKG